MTNSMLTLVDSFKEMRVLVLGDAMLDVYIDGSVERVCREAPVPIVDVTARKTAAGGAANTAANISGMGGDAFFVTVIGDDSEGRELARILTENGVPVDHLFLDPSRTTIVKNRVTAGQQILLRFDHGTTDAVDGSTEQWIIESLRCLYAGCDAILVSDYGYGLVTPKVIETIKDLQTSTPRTVVVDSKHLLNYRSVNVTSVKPNYDETVRLLGLKKTVGPEEIALYGEDILDLTGSRIAAVTLDSKGALFFERGNTPYRTYANPAHQARSTGAGDTFVSALTLSLASNASTAVAAEVASAAAAVVVGKDGTTLCSAQELRDYFRVGGKRVSDLQQLKDLLELYRKQGQVIVFTNGCFDILHRGHITYLNEAKAMGDVLIIGINSDASVRRLKGAERPINGLDDRIAVLGALSCVDHLVSFEEDTPSEIIKTIRPGIFVKGGDYTLETLPEAPLVRELGGRVEILPYVKNLSTTDLIGRIRQLEERKRPRAMKVAK